MATVDIQCVDLFDILGQKVWSGGAGTQYHRLNRPTAWWRLVGELDPTKALDWRGLNTMAFSGGALATSDDGNAPSSDATTVAKFDGYGYAKVTEATIPSQVDWTIGFWVRVSPARLATEGTTKDYMILAFGESIQIMCQITQPTVELHGRLEVTLHRYTAPVIAFSIFGPNIADDTWHHIALTNTTSLTKLFVDGKLVTSATNLGSNALDRLSPITLGDLPGDPGTQAFVGWVYDLFAYQSCLSDVSISALYEASIDWPYQNTGERIQDMLYVFGLSTIPQEISTGYGRVSPGKDYAGSSLLETMQDVADAEGGQIYIEADGSFIFRNRYDIVTRTNSANNQATFEDATIVALKYLEASPTLDLQFLYNQATFSREGGPVYQVEDTNSQSDYEIRGYDKTGLPLINDNDVISAAQWIVTRYGQPLARLPFVRYSARHNTSTMDAALNLTLQDRVTVKRKPQNVGSQWSYNVHIEGINMSIDISNMTWEVQYNLTQFGFVSGYLQVGNATYHLDNGKLGW
jgi:hypothetical protein